MVIQVCLGSGNGWENSLLTCFAVKAEGPPPARCFDGECNLLAVGWPGWDVEGLLIGHFKSESCLFELEAEGGTRNQAVLREGWASTSEVREKGVSLSFGGQET